MNLNVRNPKMVQVNLPDFNGDAALAETWTGNTLSYRPNAYRQVKPGLEIEADNRRWIVLTAVSSDDVAKGLRTLTLKAVD